MKIKFYLIASILMFLQMNLNAQCSKIHLIRHAEKSNDHPKDPSLSEQGVNRAKKWGSFFSSTNFDEIYSTDLKRTKQTASNVVSKKEISIKIYNPFELDEIFDDIKRNQYADVLVVGHSNTIPLFAKYVFGNEFDAISEDDFGQYWQITYCPKHQELNSLSVFHLP